MEERWLLFHWSSLLFLMLLSSFKGQAVLGPCEGPTALKATAGSDRPTAIEALELLGAISWSLGSSEQLGEPCWLFTLPCFLGAFLLALDLEACLAVALKELCLFLLLPLLTLLLRPTSEHPTATETLDTSKWPNAAETFDFA